MATKSVKSPEQTRNKAHLPRETIDQYRANTAKGKLNAAYGHLEKKDSLLSI